MINDVVDARKLEVRIRSGIDIFDQNNIKSHFFEMRFSGFVYGASDRTTFD